MRRNEALYILGFSLGESPSSKEIKKAFKKKAIKLHPDVNKSENAEAEFKKLNAAQELLNSPAQEAPSFSPFGGGSPFAGISDFFGSNQRRQKVNPHVQTKIRLTFKESILPLIGIFTISSTIRNKSECTPVSSEPIIMPTGSV